MPEPGSGIVLVGMPGSGKSTVGRFVAERLRRPFIDTDALVEQHVGMPVPAYLRDRGEAAFRAAESEVVARACATAGTIIGAGGGAVLDPLNRWALWHHGLVAWLDVPPAELVRRLEADDVARPTIQPYDAERLASVLGARRFAYAAADIALDGARDPQRVADDLVAARRPQGRRLLDLMVDRHHPIGPGQTRIVLGADLELRAVAPTGVAIVDRRAPEPMRTALPARARMELQGGERAKRLHTLGRVLEWLAEQRVERGEPVLALGGGTVGDLAGTAAALFARGLPLVLLPTTWLAQADSAIGGKVAVDLRGAKNAAGAFWPPVATFADVAALRSLPRRLRRDGMAESLKSALIGDPVLWRLIEERGAAALGDDEAARYAIIERSARLKLAVCERDPFETGERRALNLGHTIGHALEVESGYRLRHGPAVALGLRGVTAIACGRGADLKLPERIDDVLARLGFAQRRRFDTSAVRAAMLADKKRHAGRQRWILPMEIGRTAEVDDVTDRELDRALRTIAA